MLRENRVKRMVREGKLALSAHVSFADPALVEIVGIAGLDAAFIDMEHTTLTTQTVEGLIRAADLVGITPIVRVPDHNPKTILQLLDAGAQGIQAPHVQTAAEARELVKAVRYEPLGERGAAGSSRAAGYGSVPWAEHVKRSNEEILLLVMCEDKKGIENLDAIAAVEGVDVIIVAPTDLSESLGLRGNFDALRKVYQDVASRLRRIGKAKLSAPLGHPAMPFNAKELKAMGVVYASVHPPMGARLIRSFKDEVARIRKDLGE